MLHLIRLVFLGLSFGVALFSSELNADSLDSLSTAKADSEQYFERELGLSIDVIKGRIDKAFALRDSNWPGAIEQSAQLFMLFDQSLSLLENGLRGDKRAFNISSKISEWQRLLVQLQLAVERDLSGKFERRLAESEEFQLRKGTAQEMLIRFLDIVVSAFISAYAVDWPRDRYLGYQAEFNEKSKNSLVKIRSYIEGSQFMCRILFLDLTRELSH